MADRLIEIEGNILNKHIPDNKQPSPEEWVNIRAKMFDELNYEIQRIAMKNIFAHYFDIRTNHLNEKDWRRSFGINQLLYGMILDCTKDHKLHENFDSVLEELKKLYKEDAANE